ncbi:MAG: alpha-galactosidase [Clostridia bacterium]|nr:alpha-galactosidase [Clostridia bacterium]
MSVIINKKDLRFTLKTDNTMYVIGVRYGKFPVHLYYGKKMKNPPVDYHSVSRGFEAYYEEYGEEFIPDSETMEFPFFGSGDYRAVALKLRNGKTGGDTTLFTYKNAKKIKGRVDIPGVPCADADENTETLELALVDEFSNCELKLYYTVFPESDVISRYFVLENNSDSEMSIEKCMSLSLDIPKADFDMVSFYGAHCRERKFQRQATIRGMQSLYSRRGASSHQLNPFMMLVDKKTTEEKGEAYGFNFCYSGSFLDEVEVSYYYGGVERTRVLVGLGQECFKWLLKPGEKFASPEAIVSYSDKGMGQVSRNMHRFIRKHILPKEPYANRPIVLNSWEAFYFDIDAKLMVAFAKEAAKYDMDMLVMDDGWFGARITDNAGLGDWYENKDRFPEGLKPFVEEVKAQGVKFGIWIEPEMVNPDSYLYRAHPDWILQTPGYKPLLWRSQYVLDMANPEVVQYLKDSFAKVFKDVSIDYFKWDMNRHLTTVYSNALPPERQGEASYRHILGVYELFRWLREQYPNAMIENCSGGGGRYDLGMMKYSTQIWTSDNTDPKYRTYIQHGSTFGYPTATMSCHVAHVEDCRNPRFLDYRFRVAMNGPIGYELDVLQLEDSIKNTMKKQVAEFRCYENLILRGDFYRLLNPVENGSRYAYYFVNEDKSQILLTYLQNEGDPKRTKFKLKVSAADKNSVYIDRLSDKKITGAELRAGIVVESDTEEQYSKMFWFCKE